MKTATVTTSLESMEKEKKRVTQEPCKNLASNQMSGHFFPDTQLCYWNKNTSEMAKTPF